MLGFCSIRDAACSARVGPLHAHDKSEGSRQRLSLSARRVSWKHYLLASLGIGIWLILDIWESWILRRLQTYPADVQAEMHPGLSVFGGFLWWPDVASIEVHLLVSQ